MNVGGKSSVTGRDDFWISQLFGVSKIVGISFSFEEDKERLKRALLSIR